MLAALTSRASLPPMWEASSRTTRKHPAAELIMATAAVKEAAAHSTQVAELRQGPWGPTPLYLDALAVLHGTASDQVLREMKYLAAKLAVVQEARAQGRTKTQRPMRATTRPMS